MLLVRKKPGLQGPFEYKLDGHSCKKDFCFQRSVMVLSLKVPQKMSGNVGFISFICFSKNFLTTEQHNKVTSFSSFDVNYTCGPSYLCSPIL